MRKFYLTVAVALTLASSMMFSSCIGSFALYNKVLSWNKQVGSKFVNELVFVAFWILPVYELSGIADLLVLNSIEFWSGENPVHASTKVVDGKDAKYLVKCDEKGYVITNLTDKSVVRFDFDQASKTWSVDAGNGEHKFMQWVDDTHVKMITGDGTMRQVELSEQGVWAYEQMVGAANLALDR